MRIIPVALCLISLSPPALACDGVSFVELPNKQCLDLTPLTALANARRLQQGAQIACSNAVLSALEPDTIVRSGVRTRNGFVGREIESKQSDAERQARASEAVKRCEGAAQVNATMAEAEGLADMWMLRVENRVYRAFGR